MHSAYHCLHYNLFINVPSLPCNCSRQTRHARLVMTAYLFAFTVDQNRAVIYSKNRTKKTKIAIFAIKTARNRNSKFNPHMKNTHTLARTHTHTNTHIYKGLEIGEFATPNENHFWDKCESLWLIDSHYFWVTANQFRPIANHFC